MCRNIMSKRKHTLADSDRMKKRKQGQCKITQIPVPDGCEHPDPPYPELPRHEFTMGLIAPKGSGKTTTMINLLRLYKVSHLLS
jgi:hypothetical protein